MESIFTSVFPSPDGGGIRRNEVAACRRIVKADRGVEPEPEAGDARWRESGRLPARNIPEELRAVINSLRFSRACVDGGGESGAFENWRDIFNFVTLNRPRSCAEYGDGPIVGNCT
jgi:hypothetical protein